jgi:hypothetical protein
MDDATSRIRWHIWCFTHMARNGRNHRVAQIGAIWVNNRPVPLKRLPPELLDLPLTKAIEGLYDLGIFGEKVPGVSVWLAVSPEFRLRGSSENEAVRLAEQQLIEATEGGIPDEIERAGRNYDLILRLAGEDKPRRG